MVVSRGDVAAMANAITAAFLDKMQAMGRFGRLRVMQMHESTKSRGESRSMFRGTRVARCDEQRVLSTSMHLHFLVAGE